MQIEDVDPELRDAVRLMQHVSVVSSVGRQLGRHLGGLRPSGPRDGVTIRNVTLPGMGLRLYLPDETSGVGVLWIHGGGMVSGSPEQDDRRCLWFARELGAVAVSVDYRMAPEHPYPAPQRDCHTAWTWLQTHSLTLGVQPDRVVVAGASAGGGLAASLVNTVRDQGGRQPAAQWLLYPMLDDRTAAHRELDLEHHFVWNNRQNLDGWSALLRATAVPGLDYVPADAAPARQKDLAGLPPTWIGVGSLDLFRDESAEYARRIEESGGTVSFVEVDGAPHAFDVIGPDAALTAAVDEDALGWLRTVLGAPERV